MNINDALKEGRRDGKQYYNEGYSYRVRVGRFQPSGHCCKMMYLIYHDI